MTTISDAPTWRSSVYPKVIDELRKKRGTYDDATPRMQLADMFAVLAMLSGSLSVTAKQVADRFPRSDFVDASGMLRIDNVVTQLGYDQIDVDTYLFGATRASGQPAWRRAVTSPTQAQQDRANATPWDSSSHALVYEPARDPSVLRDEQLEQIAFLRQAVDYYDTALGQVSAATFVFKSNALSGLTGKAIIDVFLRAIRQLGDQLDAMGEYPPTTLAQDVRGALGYALDESAKAAEAVVEQGGKAAAWVANETGKLAGAAANGFLSSANLTTLAAVGVVAIVMLKKYGVL